jgi:anaerobic magnesium-protoporphyrin IX monomethyl ester cyclase
MKPKLLFVEPLRTAWFVMGEYLPPPSGLLILAAYVERELPDVEIDIVDCQADRLDWNGLEKYIASAHQGLLQTRTPALEPVR